MNEDEALLPTQLLPLFQALKAARQEMLAIQSIVLAQLAVDFAHRDLASREDRKIWFSDLALVATDAASQLSGNPDHIAAATQKVAETLGGIEALAAKILEGRKPN